jgi:hypothetical protein
MGLTLAVTAVLVLQVRLQVLLLLTLEAEAAETMPLELVVHHWAVQVVVDMALNIVALVLQQVRQIQAAEAEADQTEKQVLQAVQALLLFAIPVQFNISLVAQRPM